MDKCKWVLVIWLVLASTVSAKEVPEQYRAERMLNLCKGEVRNEDKGIQSLICTFRLQGVVIMMIENCLSTSRGFEPVSSFTSATPPSKGAARQAYINFMESNPDTWGQPWHISVSMAISEAFPCEKWK